MTQKTQTVPYYIPNGWVQAFDAQDPHIVRSERSLLNNNAQYVITYDPVTGWHLRGWTIESPKRQFGINPNGGHVPTQAMAAQEYPTPTAAAAAADLHASRRESIRRNPASRRSKCLYCGNPVVTSMVTPPPVSDNEAWRVLAAEHATGCEWIDTRAFLRDAPRMGRSSRMFSKKRK